MGQSTHSKSEEGNVEESLAAHDIADKFEVADKIRLMKQHTSQMQQEQDKDGSSRSHIGLALIHDRLKKLTSSPPILLITQRGKY